MFPFCVFGSFLYTVPVTAAVVCTRMLSLGIYGSTTSTAQHREITTHKAANRVRADQSTYLKKHVRTCMRRPGCFSGASSSWRLQVTRLHLKCCTIYYISHSLPFFFVASVAGGTARYAKRLTYVPGCTYIPAHAAVKLLCTYAHRMMQHLYSYTTHKS